MLSRLKRLPVLFALWGTALCAQEPASAPSAERERRPRPTAELRAPSVRFSLRTRSAYVVPLTEALLKPRQSSRTPATGAALKVPASAQTVGACETMPDGSSVWRLVLKSPGAQALRVHFKDFDAGNGIVWLSTPEDPASHSIGPYSGRGLFGDGEFWSGVVLSESVVIEYEPGTGEGCGPAPPFRVTAITHLWAEPSASTEAGANSCNNDVSCYPNWSKQAHSVARITFVAADGYSYLCSGTLVTTKPFSGRALFLTANHCVGTDAIARTVNAFWFYETPSCNGTAPNIHSLPYQTVGAHYLASAPEPLGDYSLIELASLPSTPTLSWSGWTTAEPNFGDTLTAIHHPGNSNDYKRISFGKRSFDHAASIEGEGLAPGQLFFSVDWTSGATEAGSSGSPLFAYNPGLRDNVVVGMDSYGPAASTASGCPTGSFAGFGRFSAAYPVLRNYLNSSACSFGFSPASKTSGPFAGSGTISVSTGTSCAWTASSDSYWLTLAAPLQQTGPGTISFNVLPNSSSTARSGTVSIGGQEFTVTQMPLQPGCTSTQIGVNQTLTGTLSSASCSSVTDSAAFANRYSISLNAGQQITIVLNSTDFDAYLSLLDPSGAVLLEDDDGGGGTNARIPANAGFYTVPAGGVYTVEATSYDPYQTGAYTLQISSPDPAAPSNPSPANGASVQSAAPTLTWTGSAGSVLYDIALSNANPPSIYATGRSATSLPLSGLTLGSKYYWYVVARNASGSAQSPVWSFTVATSPLIGTSQDPFGSFDTPLANATVSGSIGVTGWALGPAGVSAVEIWRDPVPGETPQSNGFVYLARAVFTSGARPDVQALYPNYPANDRAGWGCLLLSNMLPNTNGVPGTGNGAYRLHAIARGSDGRSAEVGVKSISADNSHATIPFGSIDTPAEGETVSGSAYVSFGWALTQMPKYIALDGSTISVIIDGNPVGHPSFNHYRQDIANLFPGYANASGAVGYFSLDTTKLKNGLHTISWTLSDSAGRSSGIGSRFFTVQN